MIIGINIFYCLVLCLFIAYELNLGRILEFKVFVLIFLNFRDKFLLVEGKVGVCLKYFNILSLFLCVRIKLLVLINL